MTTELQAPPNDTNAERALLGACLRDNDAIDDAAAIITEDDFYANGHQILWRAAMSMRAIQRPVDPVTLAEWIAASGDVRDVGGYGYLAELWDAAPSARNASEYAAIIRDYALRRRLMRAGQQMVSDASEPGRSGSDALQDAEKAILELGERGRPKATVHISVAVEESLEILDQRQRPDGVKLLRTGWDSVDRVIVGLEPGALTIIAARPSIGKTAFALAMARNIVLRDGKVFFASLEQAKAELAERLISQASGVDGYKLKRGVLGYGDGERITAAGRDVCAYEWHIDDTASQTVFHIASAIRRARNRHQVSVAFIDYLQLITPEDRRSPRHEQVQAMTRQLKFIARENRIPIIVLAQLNRELEKRADGKPRLSDLRESGAIEQDADTVMLLHSEQTAPTAYATPGDITNLEVIIAKHRNGMQGSAFLAFNKATMQIYDRAI